MVYNISVLFWGIIRKSITKSITRERINQQDWPAQARLFDREIQQRQAGDQKPAPHSAELQHEAQPKDGGFAPNSPAAENALEPETDRRSYESVMVELLMDENRQVRRTRVVHVQSGEKSTWAGWDQVRLAEWIAEQFQLKTDQPQPQPPALGGQVNIRSLDFLPASGGPPTHFVDTNQPFQVRLTLDLSQVKAQAEAPLAYQMEVAARQLGAKGKLHLTSTEGTFTLEGMKETVLFSEAAGLPDGTYRIEASLLVYAPGDLNLEQQGLRAMFEGEILQVFARQTSQATA